MKILFIGLDSKPNKGGIAELTHCLMHELSLLNNDVVLFTNIGDNSFDYKQEYKVVRRNIDPRINAFIKKIILYNYFYREFNLLRPDIVVCNTYDRLTVYAFRVAKIMKIPFFVYVHGLDVSLKRKARHEKLKRHILSNSTGIFANSKKTETIVNKIGVKKEKIYRITPGVTIEGGETNCSTKYETPALLRNKRVLVSVGRLIERKGFDTVIKALPMVVKNFPNIIYVITSDGPDRFRLESLVKELGVTDNVLFTGYVSDHEKRMYLENAQLFIMPNRDLENGDMEGFGIVFLEANLYGLPVIGGNAGGVPDAIEDGKTGYLVDSSNIEEVAFCINKILSTPEKAKEMGAYGKARALESFRWETRAKQIVDIVKKDI